MIACLGGGTGSSVPVLAGWLREMGIPHTVITSLPFGFEGKCSYAKAQKALDAIQASPVTAVPYEPMKEQREKEGGKITMLNAFEPADQEVCRRIRRILAERNASVIESIHREAMEMRTAAVPPQPERSDGLVQPGPPFQ